MEKIKWWNESLEKFTQWNSINSTTDDLYKTLNELWIKERSKRFSDIYLIKYLPKYNRDENFEKSKFKPVEWFDKYPEIKEILERYQHTADNAELKLLICKYSEETMEKARKFTEEMRTKYEDLSQKIKDPAEFTYFVWYFWGTAWRWNLACIEEILKTIPERIQEI